jgi:flagellar biosynthesis protein FlhB
MAEPESRTEEPTEHRLVEARRRGVIAVSRDLQSGLTAFAICVALLLGGRIWLAGLLAYLRGSLAQVCSRADLAEAGRAALHAVLDVLKIPLGVALAAALVGGAVQTRGLLSSYALRFDFGRILSSSRRRRGGMVWAEIGTALGKSGVVVALAWWTMRPALAGLVHLAGASADRTLAVSGALAKALGLRLALAAVALGVGDYLWNRHRHRLSLRMTRDEVRREVKDREGDPRLKSARERLRAELLGRHAMDEVRLASLVVVDDQRVAVALRYDPADSPVPVVVCKGERLMASRILHLAHEAEVPICQDQALAVILTRVDEDGEIPEASHEAVARLLADIRT